MNVAWPTWSQDGQFVYFVASRGGLEWCRVGVRDRKLEYLASLNNLKFAMRSQNWIGLTPDGSLLATREAGVREIFALNWQVP